MMAEEANTSGEFTAAETKFVVALLKNSTSDVAADWDAIALELGYGNGKIARARWNTIRRTKIVKNNKDTASPTTGVAKSPVGNKKGRPKTTVDKDTPTKKRASPKKAVNPKEKSIESSSEGTAEVDDVEGESDV